MQVRQKSIFGGYRDSLAYYLARKEERIASGINGETLKYQSRNRKIRGDLHNCIGGKTQSLCLIGFLAPHNFLDSESGQFFYMIMCPHSNGETQYQLLTMGELGF